MTYAIPQAGVTQASVGSLTAGTLNQAALARDHAGRAAAAWLIAAVVFVAWLVSPVIDDELLRAEVGYAGSAALLCTLLAVVYSVRREG